ncbi:serine/threonine-protein kinase SAPK7-like [Benincasa hispida]|uniref:serine/threonine-protein kinase SAPK7-like n=1 Tax=Benincasa hispida TaxID=102211 RepID=UPI001901403E|nr:serine/threonine-protein kinase SAPK7-like [Benincasa hispida]
MEKYEFVKDLDSGNFCVTKLMRNKQTKELVAMKFIERGPQMYSNVAREIKNHVFFPHPDIVCFKEVTITRTHLVLMMEYANGELSKNVDNSGGLSKDEVYYLSLLLPL